MPDLAPLESARGKTGTIAGGVARSDALTANARDGLRLRAGPGTSFTALRTLAFGTPLFVIGREDLWAKVDLEGDGAVDGFVLFSLLAPATKAVAAAARAVGDMADGPSVEQVAAILGTHAPTVLANIRTNLPFVVGGLRATGLTDKQMVLMAIATIGVETGLSGLSMSFKVGSTPHARSSIYTMWGHRSDVVLATPSRATGRDSRDVVMCNSLAARTIPRSVRK